MRIFNYGPDSENEMRIPQSLVPTYDGRLKRKTCCQIPSFMELQSPITSLKEKTVDSNAIH